MSDATPELKAGQCVVVRAMARMTHYRTPRYIQGKRGVVVRFCGSHGDPEQIAYGVKPAQTRRLYRVRFAQRAVWPGYHGGPHDTIDVEIYDHWLAQVGEHRGDG